MTGKAIGVVALGLLLSLGLLWSRADSAGSLAAGQPAVPKDERLSEPVQPVPTHIELDAVKVELGDRLFHDPHLSHDNSVSCASCHNLKAGGVDGLPQSVGVQKLIGPINAPTVFNSGFNFRQFWDGRAATLEAQIDGPVHASAEMASGWPEILAKLGDIPDYPPAFKRAYSAGITEFNIKDAIATFERSLYTPNAPFDRYLRGESKALSAEEREGYQLFKDYGCSSCHQGINVGGNMFQKLGVMADYFEEHTAAGPADMGRFNATHDERDRQVFKVPSLRNIAVTAPYFHDGSGKTLNDAVAVMAKYQLGILLTNQETGAIVKFLHTLTGDYKGRRL